MYGTSKLIFPAILLTLEIVVAISLLGTKGKRWSILAKMIQFKEILFVPIPKSKFCVMLWVAFPNVKLWIPPWWSSEILLSPPIRWWDPVFKWYYILWRTGLEELACSKKQENIRRWEVSLPGLIVLCCIYVLKCCPVCTW